MLINSEGLKERLGLLEPDQLTQVHLEKLIQLKNLGIELVILGSGQKLKFMPKEWSLAFKNIRLGFETMDTPAACRTYNILAGEGRKVAAFLLVEPQKF